MANKQTIIRAEMTNYSTIRNEVLLDKNLSDPAKILLIRMLNNSEEWIINVSFFRKQMNWSTDKLCGAMNSLEKNGYLIRKRIDGAWEYIIKEIGISENQISEIQICGNQISENQTLDKPNFNKPNLKEEKEKRKDEEDVDTGISTSEKNSQPQQPKSSSLKDEFLSEEKVIEIFKSNFKDKEKGERIARTAIENGRTFKVKFAVDDIKRYCDKVKATDNIQGSSSPTSSFEYKEEEKSIQRYVDIYPEYTEFIFFCNAIYDPTLMATIKNSSTATNQQLFENEMDKIYEEQRHTYANSPTNDISKLIFNKQDGFITKNKYIKEYLIKERNLQITE